MTLMTPLTPMALTPFMSLVTRVAFAAFVVLVFLAGCGDDGGEPAAPAPAPECRVEPAAVEFDTVLVGASAERTVRVRNAGEGKLAGHVRLSCPAVRIMAGGGVFSLAAGETLRVVLRWSPTALGPLSCALDLGTAACGAVACSGEAAPAAPVCEVSPPELDFGETVAGRPRDRGFLVRNAGTDTLRGEVRSVCAEFALAEGAGDFVLAPRESLNVRVVYTPGSVGRDSCRIDLGPAGDGPLCHGAGVLPPPPPSMVRVEPGTFSMGSPPFEFGRRQNETPHWVTLTRPILVSVHEVTQAEWERILGWNPSYARGASRPVEMVSWYDAVLWCNERSIIDGLRPFYLVASPRYLGQHMTYAVVAIDGEADGYRLLSEAEWERCCRALSTSAFCNGGISGDGCTPADPNLKLVAWYHCNSGLDSHDVGGKGANAWGIHDMHGNVAEWCADGVYAGVPDYGAGALTDPVGTGPGRIIRGGGWQSTASGCRSAYRNAGSPGAWHEDVGFRVARAAP